MAKIISLWHLHTHTHAHKEAIQPSWRQALTIMASESISE